MNVNQLKRELVRAGEHLGDLVFWSLTDARIDRATLESLWRAAQLDLALLPDTPTPERALRLAAREAGVGHPGCLVRLAKEDPDEIVFALVREARLGDGHLDYATEARVTLERKSGRCISDCPSHDLVIEVRRRFAQYCASHHPDDVRRALVKTLHSFAAVTLRDGGGVYWVPAVFAKQVRSLRAAIEQIGTSRVHLLPIHRSPDAQRALGELAKSSIEQELLDLRVEIQQFLATPPDRASTLTRRFDAFENLRNRARLYRSALHVEVQDLDHDLDQLVSVVEQLLQQRPAA